MQMSLPVISVHPHAVSVGVRLSTSPRPFVGDPNGRVDHSIEMGKYERNGGVT